MKDRDTLFHQTWLGLAQPIDGLVFSVPVLADAQIAPEVRPELTASFGAHLTGEAAAARIRDLVAFFRDFLGYARPGMLVMRSELPEALSFYAAEGGQEMRPSFALARGPFEEDDPFAAFDAPKERGSAAADVEPSSRFFALAWDLTEKGTLDLDAPEAETGTWKYPPTAKLERLLRHVGIPVGFLFNGPELRLVYAPRGESTAHLTFRVEHLARVDGRPLLAALELLLHARRAYTASPAHTLEGLLAESRRRQADVTEALAKQVFEAVEILVSGFEAAAMRDVTSGDRIDWLRAALEAEGEPDHFYQGVLGVVLRLVFLLYAEDGSLLPVEHPTYAEHLSLFGLYERLAQDAGAHPESMHHRFGAYGQLLSLFRAVFFGIRHGSLALPPRRGRLFDPNAYPFLEGGLPGWTAAVVDPAARAAQIPPSVDDGTIFRVLRRLVVFEGQRLSYRTLDVEQIGSVYESLMGYHVLRVTSPAVRIGKLGVWVEAGALRSMSGTERARFLKETCGLASGPVTTLEKALRDAKDEAAVLEALSAQAPGRKADLARHRADAGRLVLQPGEERRRTASHYTPRSLTEKVVRRTLEPLLACLGPERSAKQILQLKICDPAMGSGAFLVATCRELASEIVAAWARSPHGELAKVIEEHGDAHLYARRLVAQSCLYGVDKNAAAVELAKLSLWLVTLDKSLPFTFVDHALRHGDSLVGLDFRQIEAFHWAPAKQTETCRGLLREALAEVVTLREDLVRLADRDDPVAQADKRRLLAFAEQSIDRVRIVADACVGAFFAEVKEAAREKERKRRLDLVERWLRGDADAGAEVEALARDARAKLAPFHWWIEFPEVFIETRPDPLQGGAENGAALMEAVVGNPPFGGKNTIIDGNAEGYLDWLKVMSPGAHGNADLSAHFFRRAATLLGEHGAFGLIATNTIAQGDTRTTGLGALVGDGWEIYDAIDSMPWPGGSAAVTVSVVHAARGLVRGRTPKRLGDREVVDLNSRLRPTPERAEPLLLATNAAAAFVGSYVLGMGFTLTPAERDALVEKDPRNADRIFPYLGGEEVNSSPTQAFDRYVINFGQMTLAEAERWPDLLAIVREKVKPERDRDKRDARRKYWWRFAEGAPALYAAIASLGRCLAIPQQYSTCVRVVFQPTDRVLSQKLIVVPSDATSCFAVLQSSIHNAWAWLFRGRMGAANSPVYSPSDCFETFPFPRPDPRTVLPELEAAGQALYDARAAFMVETQQGLTKTYNALKDPANTDPRVLGLRRLHQAMDRAVLDAYGWTDVAVPPFCPRTDDDRAALQAFEDEVIDRLYVLNAERAREEARLGAGAKKAKPSPKPNGEPAEPAASPAPKKRAAKKPATSPKRGKGQTDLF